MTNRPELVTDEQLSYLDMLRESGVTNMFGAGAYIEKEYGLTRAEAKTILMYWMESYGDENNKARAEGRPW